MPKQVDKPDEQMEAPDLGEQLDALLAEIEQAAPGTVPPESAIPANVLENPRTVLEGDDFIAGDSLITDAGEGLGDTDPPTDEEAAATASEAQASDESAADAPNDVAASDEAADPIAVAEKATESAKDLESQLDALLADVAGKQAAEEAPASEAEAGEQPQAAAARAAEPVAPVEQSAGEASTPPADASMDTQPADEDSIESLSSQLDDLLASAARTEIEQQRQSFPPAEEPAADEPESAAPPVAEASAAPATEEPTTHAVQDQFPAADAADQAAGQPEPEPASSSEPESGSESESPAEPAPPPAVDLASRIDAIIEQSSRTDPLTDDWPAQPAPAARQDQPDEPAPEPDERIEPIDDADAPATPEASEADLTALSQEPSLDAPGDEAQLVSTASEPADDIPAQPEATDSPVEAVAPSEQPGAPAEVTDADQPDDAGTEPADQTDETGVVSTDAAELAAIDDELAATADEALNGDFETVEDILASAEAELEQDLAAANAEPAAQATSEAPVQATDTGATADDVARELDEQPEAPVAQPIETAPQAEAQPAAAAAATTAAPADKTRRAISLNIDWRKLWPNLREFKPRLIEASRRAIDLTMRTCERLNAPLQRLSPDARNAIGYIGLLTLFNAIGLILYALLF